MRCPRVDLDFFGIYCTPSIAYIENASRKATPIEIFLKLFADITFASGRETDLI
jgi:hypothetical protein